MFREGGGHNQCQLVRNVVEGSSRGLSSKVGVKPLFGRAKQNKLSSRANSAQTLVPCARQVRCLLRREPQAESERARAGSFDSGTLPASAV